MSALRAWWRRLGGRGPVPGRCAVDVVLTDPLETLAVQTRLAELSAEIRRIELAPDLYARAHHWRAAVIAYDVALRDACRLAGVVPTEPPTPLTADTAGARDARLNEELELAAHGWSW
ncbi:hypothetical protein [Luteimicrobium subarcticum]|uniref:Uncharacterized protein n=1 Tax=Luteimicrobium subarcticum TaxID=620910 RepID=A0A2M8WSB8_9MICO|nr:hypothetical protein [Luteimicrobium subarcticum]PJI93818.1 hypothetical protein CLV34_1294 [Luteimicrobium subarcticum]